MFQKTKDQKLIYSGQLLNDSVCLEDVLRHYENIDNQPFIVHLVCAPSRMSNKNINEKNINDATGSTKASSSSERITADSTTEARLDSPVQETVNTQPTAQVYSTQSYYGQLNMQQIAWMQQAYTHYLTQYMQL